MKLAVSTYSLSRWKRQENKSTEDVIQWIADHAPAIEFVGLDDKAAADPVARARELRALCVAAGLEIAGYCVGAEFLVPPDKQPAVIDQVKREVDIAAALGAKTMRHDVTRGPSESDWTATLTFDQVLAALVPAIRQVADHAQSLGVIATFENHGFYMQASERVEKLLQAVDHPNFRLTLDMGNFLCVNEDPVQAVARLAKYAVNVHAKDFHVKPKSQKPPSGWFATPTEIALRGAIVGHGVVDVPAQLRLLKDVGYDGYLSLEFEGMEDPPTAVCLGLDYLGNLLDKADA